MRNAGNQGLWEQVQRATEGALARGALLPIATTSTTITDGGVPFILRALDNLRRKGEARKRLDLTQTKVEANPFLPYDEDLLVSHLTASHVCLLNKFNVLDHHLLLVTRDFEDQDQLLTEADFEALWLSLSEIDGLGFYNGGTKAGASQRHKHLQLVPLPLEDDAEGLPIEPLLADRAPHGPVEMVRGLPFAHVFAELDSANLGESPQAALYQTYLELAAQVGVAPGKADGRHRAAYNLLVTKRWMLMVPRAAECFEGISVNALGFVGALLVRTPRELEIVRRAGPMKVLQEAAKTRP